MSAGSQCRGRGLRRDNRDTGAGSAPNGCPREKEPTLNTAEPVKLIPSSANLGRIFLLPASPASPGPEGRAAIPNELGLLHRTRHAAQHLQTAFCH